MTLPTTADFNNAKRDLDDLAEIVTSPTVKDVPKRLGGNTPTLSKVMSETTDFLATQTQRLADRDAEIDQTLVRLRDHAPVRNRGAWITGTTYEVNDIWQAASDVWYVVVEEYVAGATDVADIASGKVFVHQVNIVADMPADTIADLRLFEPSQDGQHKNVTGHTVAGIGGDPFYYDASDTTSPDNNGTVIRTTIGDKCWKRRLSGVVTPEMFGATYLGDDSEAFKGAMSIGLDVTTSGKEITINGNTVGYIPDNTVIRNSKLNIEVQRIALIESLHLSSCTIKGRGINLLGGKKLTFNKLHFQDILTNGIMMNGNNKVHGFNLSGDNIGTSPTLSPSSEGHVVFGVDSLVDSECVVHGFFATNTFGQGAIGNTRCRNFKIYDSIVDSTAYRAFSFFGNVTDGLGPLGHEIINTTISRCGEVQPSSSGVGCNGIFSQTASNASGGVLEDLVVRNATITNVAENGIEGHGIFENITIKNTGAYPLLSTPSKEGAYIQGNSSCKNFNIYDAEYSGIVLTPSSDNLIIDGLYIDGYKKHGIESNNYASDNYVRDNFVIKNVEIAQEPTDLTAFRSVFIDDTSTGVTSYGVRSRIENVTVAGKTLFSYSESGGSKLVSRALAGTLRIVEEYSCFTTTNAPLSSGTHYLTDRIRNVLGIATGMEYEYVCVRSGTFEPRSATSCEYANFTKFFDSSASTLEVGDVVSIPAGSDTVNNTVKRWTVTHIQGLRHFVDRIIYGDSTTATIQTAPPEFLSLVLP